VTRTLPVLVAALVLACATPARATLLAGGEIDRGDAGAQSLSITVDNGSDSGELFQALRIELPVAAGQLEDVATNGAPASCAPSLPATVQCQFPPPYLQPGEGIEVTLTTQQAIGDEAGRVFVCAYPCSGPYAGPFTLVGPFATREPPINADAAVRRFRSRRLRAHDVCSPARPVFQVALAAVCVDRNSATLRAIVVNPSYTQLHLTIFGPGWVKRLRVPANGGAGFTRRRRLKKSGRLLVVDGVSGAKTSLPMRLPPKRKRR
jgi:hypothetical protein